MVENPISVEIIVVFKNAVEKWLDQKSEVHYIYFLYGFGCDLENIVVALKERKTLVQITSRRNQNLGRKCWDLSRIEQLVRTKGKHRSSR